MMETDGLGRPLASIVVLASRGVGTVSLLVLVLVLLAPLENGWPVEFAPPSGLQRPKLIWHPTSQCSLVLPHHPCSEQQSPYSEPWQVRITAVPQVPSCETSTTCADARAASPRRRTAGAHRHSHPEPLHRRWRPARDHAQGLPAVQARGLYVADTATIRRPRQALSILFLSFTFSFRSSASPRLWPPPLHGRRLIVYAQCSGRVK